MPFKRQDENVLFDPAEPIRKDTANSKNCALFEWGIS
jgi:hypothetical protein